MKILISGCLLGLNCKFNGGNNLNEDCVALKEKHTLIPICPEQLGGLATPRAASEIINGTGVDVLSGEAKVMDLVGIDETQGFIRGAVETLKIFKMLDCDIAVLKARSPSCGCGKIYDGTFSGNLRDGNGVAAELLLRNEIKVLNEDNTKNLLY